MKTKTPDEFDIAIAYLTKHPEELSDAWGCPSVHRAGCLFRFPATYAPEFDSTCYGCPTFVKKYRGKYGFISVTPALTKAIRADKSLPSSPGKIRIKHLRLFAKWQRRIQAAALKPKGKA